MGMMKRPDFPAMLFAEGDIAWRVSINCYNLIQILSSISELAMNGRCGFRVWKNVLCEMREVYHGFRFRYERVGSS